MSPLKVLLCLWLCAIPAWSFAINPQDENRARNESRIAYELFTPLNPDEPQILILEDLETLLSSNFNSSLPTKFFAHGWNSGPSSADSTRKEYLKKEKCNFIAIDWAWFSAGIDYPLIILRNVPIVANHTAAFIDSMVELVDADVRTMHLIGFSAGAHVVGGTGAMITSGRIPRITGLDPAKPFLTLENTENRLDTTDADFVDVIHTDAGNLIGDELGFPDPIGHIDFYPNGGTDQPGCALNGVKGGCDHTRAPSYFTESINSPVGFRAVQCDSWDNFLIGRCDNNPSEFMGEPVTYGANGVYYLATNAQKPYAIEG